MEQKWISFRFNNQDAATKLQCEMTDDALELIVDSKAYRFSIGKRPDYCDRGRFIVYADNKNVMWNPIDSADFFPRYYFSLQRCLDELKDLIEFREAKIDFTKTETEQHEMDKSN